MHVVPPSGGTVTDFFSVRSITLRRKGLAMWLFPLKKVKASIPPEGGTTNFSEGRL
jgi:hypothetical protein